MSTQSNWQPISTAPKDKTYILLFFPVRGGCCSVGFWSVINGAWWLTSLSGGGVAEGDLVPTHWMPLPEPPQ